jgi:transposase InsO family protein
MPFRESSAMEERIALLREYETKAFTVSELCRRYGISRETFYFWKRRRASGDERWFEDRSHATHSCPNRTLEWKIEPIVAMRRRFPLFGAKKIKARLELDDENVAWPAISTIGDILSREGLVEPRRRRRRAIAQGEIETPVTAPNQEWAIDFKGWFRTRDGKRCDPLTITDGATRYLIEVRAVRPDRVGVKEACERVFGEVGLPDALRSDNGPPFGSTGAGGLSQLSVWWLKLGIEPHYIPPASPQDNGRHERMHGTLKQHTSRPAAATIEEQQLRFDAFRQHYNAERPHEALGQVMPARDWRPSPRPMPSRVEEPWYDADHQVRRVRPAGTIKWAGKEIFIGEAFANEIVGLAEHDTGGHIVRFCRRDLGIIYRDGRFQRFAPPRARLRKAPEADMTPEQ